MSSLDTSTSPYLRQYKDSPVAWRAWGPDVFAEAKASGKPVFLNIGYVGCSGCHVMRRECFADRGIAALLNENYIPVLVDRDERPDVELTYQTMASLLGQNIGWPLNVFLTDDAKPYLVTGFLGKDGQEGHPGMAQVLADMAKVYKEKPQDARANADNVARQLEALYTRDTRAPLESIQLNIAAMRIGQRYDIFLGGITGETKFPVVPLLEVLWRAYLRTGTAQFLQLVSVTMDHILTGGLYDHVGGGFFRHTMDEGWLAPHFEKMLIDNALLVEFMTSIWQFNHNGVCRQAVFETVEWLLSEMRLDGAFAAALDSVSDGVEGKYYVWTEAEIDEALNGTFMARFKQVYGIRQQPGQEPARFLPRRLGQAPNPPLTEADEALLAKQRGLLRQARAARARPARDDKLLADANGLTIRALAVAGMVFEKPQWVEAAVAAFDTICQKLGEGDVLHHSWADGKRGARGFSDDYANMASAALQLFQVTGQVRFLDAAKGWTRTLNTQFWDTGRDGYCFTGLDGDPPIVRPRMVFDQPYPSANGTMVSVLTDLALLTGQADYGARAQDLLAAFAAELGPGLMSCGTYLNGFEVFATGLQLVIVGPRAHARTQELVRAIWSKSLPNRLVTVVEKSEDLPPGHPAHGKPMEGGQPTAYVCQRQSCSPPITSAATLSQALTLPVSRQAMVAAAGNA